MEQEDSSFNLTKLDSIARSSLSLPLGIGLGPGYKRYHTLHAALSSSYESLSSARSKVLSHLVQIDRVNRVLTIYLLFFFLIFTVDYTRGTITSLEILKNNKQNLYK